MLAEAYGWVHANRKGIFRVLTNFFAFLLQGGRDERISMGRRLQGIDTMTIHDELAAELVDAIKTKDKARANVIRQVETEVATVKSAPGFEGEVDDAVYLATIATYVKRMDKARREYETAGERGAANAEKLAWEIQYLARWLPQTLGEEETRRTVRAAIAELKADDPKMAGRVIGHVMKHSGKDLDGALVNRIVREELGA
jgi:uncharacterized protein YqeY